MTEGQDAVEEPKAEKKEHESEAASATEKSAHEASPHHDSSKSGQHKQRHYTGWQRQHQEPYFKLHGGDKQTKRHEAEEALEIEQSTHEARPNHASGEGGQHKQYYYTGWQRQHQEPYFKLHSGEKNTRKHEAKEALKTEESAREARPIHDSSESGQHKRHHYTGWQRPRQEPHFNLHDGDKHAKEHRH